MYGHSSKTSKTKALTQWKNDPSFKKPFLQRSLNEQRDHISSVRLQLQELSRMFSPGIAQEGLSYLKTSLDSLKQQVSTTEGLKDHLGK